jgi:hypothetical protein
MGLCNDQSVTFLKGLGYNVVRHPSAALKPLDLIGIQNKESGYLGPLNLLITNPPASLPQTNKDIPAANINGKKSSKLSIGIGVNILGSVIGAMGGNLGIDLSYTDAKTIEFQYSDVLNDEVVPLEVGNYLRDGEVDAGNLILKQYVLGNGKLYLTTKIAKSKKFTVSFERSNGSGAKVDVPIIQAAVGGKIDVKVDTTSKHVITFEGPQPLAFGFQCYQVGVRDGNLDLLAVQSGAVPLSVTGGAGGGASPTLINGDGLLDLR